MSTAYKANLDSPNAFTGESPTRTFKIWDLGPQPPKLPQKPALPDGKEGDPKFDLAMIEFRGALAVYEDELRAYGQAQKDFAEWHRRYGGPYQIEWLSPDAREAMENDRDRYVEKLPKGVKPGKWQADLERQAADRASELQTLARRDPAFGLGLQGAPA